MGGDREKGIIDFGDLSKDKREKVPYRGKSTVSPKGIQFYWGEGSLIFAQHSSRKMTREKRGRVHQENLVPTGEVFRGRVLKCSGRRGGDRNDNSREGDIHSFFCDAMVPAVWKGKDGHQNEFAAS